MELYIIAFQLWAKINTIYWQVKVSLWRPDLSVMLLQ